jgi:hypothetical protein
LMSMASLSLSISTIAEKGRTNLFRCIGRMLLDYLQKPVLTY